MATESLLGGRPSPRIDYAEQIIDRVRAAIAPEDWVLEEARKRRDRVRRAAAKFRGQLETFASGSLAHRTVNNPVLDADLGLVLDRRSWPDLGPDSASREGPDDVMTETARHVIADLRREYPQLTYRRTKRAILFEFHAPLDDEDPSADLVLCLTRRDEPGYWIPNRDRGRWDASHPLLHAQLMGAEPRSLRVFRARAIRLAKAAINNDRTPVVVSWNISALALEHVTQTRTRMAVGLADFFEAAAKDIARRRTPDPANVSPPIKLPPGVDQDRAARRLGFFASKVREAADHADDHTVALTALGEVFRDQLLDAPRSSSQATARALRTGDRGAVVGAFGAGARPGRSWGGA